MSNFDDLNLNKLLYRETTPTNDVLSLTESYSSSSNSSGGSSSGSETTSESISSGELIGNIIMADGFLMSKNYVSASTGWKLTPTSGEFNFAVSVDSLDIPDATTASSMHVDIAGNTWWGTNTATGYATATASILATGVATFKSATIGNWSVNTTSIYTGTEDHSGYTANAGDITLYSDGSDSSIHANQFYIDNTGSIYATNGAFSGTLTIGGRLATIIGGAIDADGDFINDLINARLDTEAQTILSTFTFGVSGAIQIGTYSAGVSGDIFLSPSGIVGRNSADEITFSVDATTGNATFAGSLAAASGTLGTITSGTFTGVTLSIGTGDSIFKADANGIYLGDATFADAPFSVNMSGALKATSATVTGAITTGVGSSINGTYIDSLGVGKLTAGTINSQTITLASTTSDAYISAGKTDFDNTVAGFILGTDYSDSGKAKFYIGDADNYFNWTGAGVSIFTSTANAITIDYGSDILLKEGGNIEFTSVVKPTACTAALAGDGAGNVDDGTHTYQITYINDTGETELGVASNTITVTDKTSDGKVNLTNIPVSTSSSVIARKIYRTKAGASINFLLTTIADNTTTTYTDNTADASLTGVDANNLDNSTFGKMVVDGIESLTLGTSNTFIGRNAGADITTGFSNTAIGLNSLNSVTSGYYNVAVGVAPLLDNTTGYRNIALGFTSLANNIGGYENVAIGDSSMNTNTSGYGNTALGINTGYTNSTGNLSVFLGNNAGYYETASNKLFIDNDKRDNEADGRVKALIYGVFDAAIANQLVRLNGVLELTSILSGSTQANAGAAANEVWKTSGHASLPDNVLMIGV